MWRKYFCKTVILNAEISKNISNGMNFELWMRRRNSGEVLFPYVYNPIRVALNIEVLGISEKDDFVIKGVRMLQSFV